MVLDETTKNLFNLKQKRTFGKPFYKEVLKFDMSQALSLINIPHTPTHLTQLDLHYPTWTGQSVNFR